MSQWYLAAGVKQFVMVTSLGTGKVGFPASVLNLFWGVLSEKRKAEQVRQGWWCFVLRRCVCGGGGAVFRGVSRAEFCFQGVGEGAEQNAPS